MARPVTIGYYSVTAGNGDNVLVTTPEDRKTVLLTLNLLPTTTTAVSVYLKSGSSNMVGSAASPYKLDLAGVGGAKGMSLNGDKHGLCRTGSGENAIINLSGAQPVIAFGAYAIHDA